MNRSSICAGEPLLVSSCGFASVELARRHFTVGDYLQHVDAGNTLLLKEVGRVRVGFQQQRGEQVAGMHLLPLRAARLVE